MSVYYSGATHGWWCNTKTRPWRCKYCKEDILYFTCDCGCKVFFEKPAPPWEQHECQEYLEHVETQAELKRIERELAAAKALLSEVKQGD